MSLRGELREFELPDILQLIASQKKAGWLKVISRGQCHFVFFRDGRITSTKNPADDEDPFAEYIRRRGILTPEQADRVAATRRKTGMDVHDILQKEGLLEPHEIQEIFDGMVEHDIFELMSIRSGTYEFETEDRPGALPEGALCAEIGPILMEAARKADEVAEMRRALGPADGVLTLTSVGREAKPRHSDEAAVLGLVNSMRPIDVVIEESGLDRYTATRTLFDCAREGWVKLTKRKGKGADVEDVGAEPEIQFDPRRALQWGVPVLALLGLAILFSNDAAGVRRDDPILGEFQHRTHCLEIADRREALRRAVEVYKLSNGEYPASLDALVEEALLPGRLVRDGDQPLWNYARDPDGDSYALLPR
jgi:hypothetical protein